MLSIEQCRGARGILGWTQQDLADASGLSKTAINNFEKGHSDIKAESLRAIRTAFEMADIEFLEQSGVRKKSENMKIFRGANARHELTLDLKLSISECNEDIKIITAGDSVFNPCGGPFINNYAALLKEYNITQRVLAEAVSQIKPFENQDVRGLGEGLLEATPNIYIYANRVAFELADGNMVIIIDSADAQNAESKRFEYLWNKAEQETTYSKSTKRA